MSWLLHLCETYNSNENQVGKFEQGRGGQSFTLLPVSHTTQNVQIEVLVTEDGTFHSAQVIGKVNTLIPCTDKAASRAGKVVSPYALHDKLSYVAGDFKKYGGEIKTDEEPFQVYITQLGEWAHSPYATSKVEAIYQYVKKGTLIEDLIEEDVIILDENHQILKKWDKKLEEVYGEKPQIFSVVANQEAAFVRFNVYSPDPDKESGPVWEDHEMYDSFILFNKEHLQKDGLPFVTTTRPEEGYFAELLRTEDVCFVAGQTLSRTSYHANKIRHAADKAKLISANDGSGFTYRGRFKDGTEAASISYEVSQKAHNALKWLILRQGKMIDERVFLVWGNEGDAFPMPEEDAWDILNETSEEEEEIAHTQRLEAAEVEKAIDGYKHRFSPSVNVNILVLDSATTGRMAVLYYRHMNKEHYLNRLTNWHLTCNWRHRYRKNEGKTIVFEGAPATRDIAFAAYGSRASDKIVKGLMERMLPCIVDSNDQYIPRDIVRSALLRASNPVSMEKWEWEKTLSIACALIRKQLIVENERSKDQKEVFTVALDRETDNRSYLFGRLLAIADVLERRALPSEEMRATNAVRYMNAFSKHPERTWQTIQASLQPYQARLGKKANYLSRMIDEVGNKFKMEDFNNEPLSGKYLLGFYSQREALYEKKETNTQIEGEESS